MSTFNLTKLAGHRVLVTGDTDQQCILHSQEYDSLSAHLSRKDVGEKADEIIRAHFAPLTDQLSELEKQLADEDKEDPAFEVVESEGTEGVKGERRVAYRVSKDTAVLRLLNSDDHSRLIWVGNDTIEIIAL